MARITSLILTLILSLPCIGQSSERTYSELLNEIREQRSIYHSAYLEADSLEKNSIINEVRIFLTNALSKDIFSNWYGTKWDFNGTTRTPKKGHIACGYFVTNTLADLGFQIPRIKWAQSASEYFIKKLAGKQIKRFYDKPISVIEEYLLDSGNGVYLVGLDIHVGYIVVKNKKIMFVHSSYYKPDEGVIAEKLNSWNPLRDSKYLVIGKLMSDQMIIHWILNTPYS